MMIIDREMAVKSPEACFAPDLHITPRMFDVLELALQGYSAKKIASLLGINDSNVRHYLSRLYERFRVTSRYGLQAKLGPSMEFMRLVAGSPGPDRAE